MGRMSNTSDESMSSARDDNTELRVEAPSDLCAVLDGLARGRHLTRNQLVLRVLHEYVDIECNVHSVLGEAARRNPIVAEKLGKARG